MDTCKRSIRIMMFPWLAHGHISPFLELAKSLSKRKFSTYICSSSVNLNSIKKNLSEKHSISIKLVELHLPTTPDLLPHHHTTNGLPPHLMNPLKKAFDSARPEFSNILDTLKPDLLIYDFLQPWAAEEAAAQNIPAVLFFENAASTTSFLTHKWLRPESEYPFPDIYFRENEANIFSRLVDSAATGTRDDERVRECVRRSCDIVLIKTYKELEGKYIDYISDLTRKKFVPVGPLVCDMVQAGNEENEIIKWLDGKERRSTVFASFGSEYFLSKNEFEEIAFGLEMSGVDFIWVVRFPMGEKIKIEDVMPKGFLERVKDKGMVVEGWAPQQRILSHESVGGFLSHCGWSSVMEGIYFGVPIVAVPMHLDQPLNARLVVEMGFGEEVVRNREWNLEREEVARVVKKVVVEADIRRRAAELSEEMRRKGDEDMDGVVEEFVRLCSRKGRLSLSTANSMDTWKAAVVKREVC